jgi:hypothetical protein
VTAVTTAGLLAGLFGSAFVPAVNAARVGAADPAPKASVTTVTEDDSGLIMEGATNKFGFLSSNSDQETANDDVQITFVINSAGGTPLQNADLKAVSSNSAVQVAWAYTSGAGPVADTCSDIDGDGEDNILEDVGAGDESADNVDAFATSDTVLEAPDGALGAYILCLAAGTATSAGTSTVTISAAASGTEEFVVLKTLTVTAIGPVASLALSITDGYKYVAEGNDELGEWLTVVGKDSNGTTINGDTGTISAGFDLVNTITEWEDNPEHSDGDTAINFWTGDSGVNNATGGSTLYDLEINTCLDDADDDFDDAGNSFSLKIANAAQTVVSNAITITCTTDSALVARVTRIYAEATTGASVYNETATGSDDFLSLFAVVVDANGMPLGDGAATQDYGWSIDGAVAITSEFTDNGTEVAVGGEIELGTLCETIDIGGACTEGIDFGRNGRFTYAVAAADSDLSTTTNVELEVELTYTAVGEDDVAISQTRNAAKTRATIAADMGESNAFERIEFTVELANGTVKTFIRRANASGVATLVQSRRKTTVYVYADVEDGGGSPTDVLKVVFK